MATTPTDRATPGELDRPPWKLWTAPAAVLFGLVFGSLASLIVEVIGHAFGSSLSNPNAVTLIVADIAFDLCFVAAALVLVWSSGARAADFGFRRVALSTAVLWVVGAAICYYLVTAIYAALFSLHGQDKLPSELSDTHSTVAIVLTAAFVCAIAPMCEEFFFRGFLFGTLRTLRVSLFGVDVAVWFAAVVTGILFGLVHYDSASPQYLIPLGFLGFILCIVRWRTGSLYPGMALHSANNAIALGVTQLHWSAEGIVGLILASWLVIAAVAGPLGARTPALTRPAAT
jgi:membrane protease YdiL (CAAX protease family)